MVPDALRNLGRQAFLHLKTTRIAVEDAREFRNADDAVLRQIGDRRLAGDRRNMMLAVRLKGTVAQQHDLVLTDDLFEGARKMPRRSLETRGGKACGRKV